MSRHITSAISQAFGKFANKEFSKPVQNFINNGYVKLMGLDMNEFHSPETYSSLNALFTRKLKEDRTYSLDADDFISPCDSWISECGDLHEDYALQIKGMRYKADDFIGNDFTQEEKNIVHNTRFGINLGGFGFLTEVKCEELGKNLANLQDNKIKIEERLILDIQLNRKGKAIKKNESYQ